MNPGPLNAAGPDTVDPDDFNEDYYGIVVEQPSERERRAHRDAYLIDCPRCGGDGEIGVQGFSHNPRCGFPTPDPQCDTTARCPDCFGTGAVRPDDFDNERGRAVDAADPVTHEE